MKKPILEKDEDSESDNNDYRQIEVSHGSTSNPSQYASTIFAYRGGTLASCCDVVCIVVVMVILSAVLLFWYDYIPIIAKYFKNSSHYAVKIIIFALSMAVVCVISVVLFIRCCRCICTRSCQNRLLYMLNCRRRRMITIESFTESGESGVQNRETAKQLCVSATPKVEELAEEQLLDLRRILRLFLNYHDRNDWSMFTSSCSQNLSSSTIFQNKIKLKVSMKIVLVGNPNVGKTSIFHRVLYDRFSEYYMATLGVDLGIVTLYLFPEKLNENILIILQVWDIAGSEKFSELSHIIYKDANAYLLVCDATEVNFMEHAIPWIRDIQSAVCQPHISLFFNKIDDKDKLVTPVIDQDLYRFESYSVSAKTGENVLDNLVTVVAKSLLHEIDKYL